MMEEDGDCLEKFKEHMCFKHCFLTELGWLDDHCMPVTCNVTKDLQSTLIGECPMVASASDTCHEMAMSITPDCIREIEMVPMDAMTCPMEDAAVLHAVRGIAYFHCVRKTFDNSCMDKANHMLAEKLYGDMGDMDNMPM